MKLHNEDCIVQMQKMIDAGIQVDSVVTDPPYELGFMGKSWDSTGIAFQKETWELAFQLLKPGGHLLAFGGSRTYHRMAVAIEDAGFDIRDQIMWLYGSGFPKSFNIGKAIDKLQGNNREVVGSIKTKDIRRSVEKDIESGKTDRQGKFAPGSPTQYMEHIQTKGSSPHEGWGTALKPAHEPVVLARKPLSEKTVAENVLKYGTGGINIDGCRIETEDKLGGGGEKAETTGKVSEGWKRPWMDDPKLKDKSAESVREKVKKAELLGRFPANVMHDGSEEVLEGFPETSKSTGGGGFKTIGELVYGDYKGREFDKVIGFGDEGSAARYFYCPKVSKNERNRGLDKNIHPTVKPIELMKYLCRLVTPKGGTILDPFMGSGSTGMAAKDEGFEFIGIEQEKEYFEIAKQRIKIISPLNEFFEKD